MTLTRRELLAGSAAAAALHFVVDDRVFAADAKYAAAFKAIDAMVERYLREMNAPGLTLAIANRSGVLRAATYGFSDIDRKERVTPEHLFQIGSISKSFTGAALLQLRDEGKLDLHAPVTRYLPWLRIEPREIITTHHLLTHSSGLPSWAPVFPTDPGARHTAGYAPGTHFWYCNVAYAMLGLLVETLDGRPYFEAIRARIFEPVGMSASVAYISHDTRARTANSYVPFLPDRPYPRMGRLADAPQIVFDNAAGSISATPGDMGRYLAMIANRGKGVLSATSFEEWVKGYVPTAPNGDESYGYGWFTGKLDGQAMVRHTGGMVSFMSAAHVDLEDGVGAFASINAQLGYRPNPVSTYAISVIRAVNDGKPIPDAPAIPAAHVVRGAKELAGVYTSADGERIEFVVEGEGLALLRNGRRHAVETAGGLPIIRTPELELFPFFFDREKKTVAHGSRLWLGAGYTGERTFDHPAAWNAFTGHYRGESAWVGSVRFVAREGKLWYDGTIPMRPVDAITFRLTEPEHCPEWVQFLDVVNGKSRHIKISGEDLYRVDAP